MAHYRTDVVLWTSSANAVDGTGRRTTFHKAASLPLCCSTYMTSLFIPTQGVSYTPMICALPHRSNPLRRWGRLLVTHSKAWLHTTLPTTSRLIQRKTQISTFHLKNRDAQRELKVVLHGKLLAYSHKPVYLGVTLDRCLTYKDHIAKTKAKTGARNSILKKLANTNWGTDARTIRTTALCFSSAGYASL